MRKKPAGFFDSSSQGFLDRFAPISGFLGGTDGGLHVAIAGQSNAALRGNSTLVDYALAAGTSYTPATVETSTSFTPPAAYPSQALAPIAPSGLNSGFELGLGQTLIKTGTATATLPITKMGIDGTAIATWNNSTNFNRWVASLAAREASTGRPITDICWSQGEADGATTPLATAYAAGLATFLAAVHATRPAARFHFQVLSTSVNIATVPERATIRAAQIAAIAANSSWCFPVYVDDMEFGADGVHFTANAYWAIGVRHAESIRTRVGNQLPNSSIGGAPYVRAIPNAAMSSSTVGASVIAHAPPSKVGDTQLLIISAGNLNEATTLTDAQGFAEVTNSPQFSLSGGNYARLSVYSRVWDGVTTDPTVSGGTQQRRTARIITIAGTSGQDITPAATVNNAFSTSATIASVTTASANTLVLRIHASYATADNSVSAVSGGTLLLDSYGPVKQMLQIFADTQAAAGASGACTFTHATTSLQANLVMAFKP